MSKVKKEKIGSGFIDRFYQNRNIGTYYSLNNYLNEILNNSYPNPYPNLDATHKKYASPKYYWTDKDMNKPDNGCNNEYNINECNFNNKYMI